MSPEAGKLPFNEHSGENRSVPREDRRGHSVALSIVGTLLRFLSGDRARWDRWATGHRGSTTRFLLGELGDVPWIMPAASIRLHRTSRRRGLPRGALVYAAVGEGRRICCRRS